MVPGDILNAVYMSCLFTEYKHARIKLVIYNLFMVSGYGTITPKTDGGRLLCIFYALFGIPVAALLLQALGKSHHALVSATIKAVESKCTSGKEVVYQEEKCVLGTLISFIFMICIGAWIYTNEEGTYLEGTYAWFITFTTIGYGDIVPGGHSKNPGYIWVRLIVIMLGLTVTASVLTAISSCLEKRDVKALTCSGCPAGCLVKLCCPAGRCYGHSVGSPGTYRSDPVFELDNSGRIQEDEEKNA
ncbi:predicted protein [Nematostella vectensis]|uniref:Potassium channel domain-containing protein n=1 Tax=Nematostella vectensis TaxID=45351 RepID=A7S0F9_NEMVE|nr:predicted protein [Nematostella vectensis]|eukprot:XP_001634930.1 predicted protein [Nematostella vectensis]